MCRSQYCDEITERIMKRKLSAVKQMSTPISRFAIRRIGEIEYEVTHGSSLLTTLADRYACAID